MPWRRHSSVSTSVLPRCGPHHHWTHSSSTELAVGFATGSRHSAQRACCATTMSRWSSSRSHLMRLPDPVAYQLAVQHPSTAFTDADLRAATVTTNRLGLPKVVAGNFALTYQL